MIGSIPDLAVIIVLGALLFGAKNIPELGKNLGRGLREFKSGMNDLKSEIETTLEPPPARVETVTSKATASVSAPSIETQQVASSAAASSSATPNNPASSSTER